MPLASPTTPRKPPPAAARPASRMVDGPLSKSPGLPTSGHGHLAARMLAAKGRPRSLSASLSSSAALSSASATALSSDALSSAVTPSPPMGVRCLCVVLGSQIWAGSRSGKIFVYDAVTRRMTASFVCETREAVTALAFLDGKVWVGFSIPQIEIWDAATRTRIKTLQTASSSSARGVTDIKQIGKDMVWIASQDFTVRVFRSGDMVQLLTGHENWCLCIEPIDELNECWSGGADNVICRWSSSSPSELLLRGKIEGLFSRSITCICYTPGAVWIGDQGGSIKVVSPASHQVIALISDANLSAVTTIFAIDSATLMVAGVGKQLGIYDSQLFAREKSIEQVNTGFISSVLVHGNNVWVGSSDLRTYPIEVLSTLYSTPGTPAGAAARLGSRSPRRGQLEDQASQTQPQDLSVSAAAAAAVQTDLTADDLQAELHALRAENERLRAEAGDQLGTIGTLRGELDEATDQCLGLSRMVAELKEQQLRALQASNDLCFMRAHARMKRRCIACLPSCWRRFGLAHCTMRRLSLAAAMT